MTKHQEIRIWSQELLNTFNVYFDGIANANKSVISEKKNI